MRDSHPSDAPSRAPTALVILHEPVERGASRAVLRIAKPLAERGWNVRFWAPRPSALFDRVATAGWPVDGAPKEWRWRLASLRAGPGVLARLATVPRYAIRLWKAVRGGEIDLVHANTIQSLPEAILARLAGARVVVHVHEALPGGMLEVAVAAALRRMDAVIAVSRHGGAALAVRGVRAAVIPNGVPAPRARRAEGDGDPVVGFLGTVSKDKGADRFVDLIQALRAQGVRVEARMAGPLAEASRQPWARSVKARAEAAGIAHLPAPDVERELSEWTVLVVPSRRDAFPLSVLEAMAAGVPVVAFAVGGVPEQLGDDAGVLVAPGDVPAMAAAVETILAAPGQRNRLATAARRRVGERFTLVRQAEAVAAVWTQVVRAGRDVSVGAPAAGAMLRRH